MLSPVYTAFGLDPYCTWFTVHNQEAKIVEVSVNEGGSEITPGYVANAIAVETIIVEDNTDKIAEIINEGTYCR